MTPLRRTLLTLTFVVLCICAALSWWSFSALEPPAASKVEIKPGASLIRIANTLADKKIIRSALAFRLLARLQNHESAIQAGSYAFTSAATPAEILERLVTGDVILTRVTIPEGFNLQQVIDRLVARNLANRESLRSAAQDPLLLAQLGIRGSSVEGYLFPETYRFVPGTSEADLLRMMVAEFERQFARLRDQSNQQLPLQKSELVTLASIIQKETGLNEEMPLISSVFHNRLKRGIALQTDPTVIYGIENFNGNLTRADLQRPSPYNTYLNPGLPPGPISNPGLTALRAAANPASTNFLYFVARGDGSHQFSATLREHNRAVREYQLKRRH